MRDPDDIPRPLTHIDLEQTPEQQAERMRSLGIDLGPEPTVQIRFRVDHTVSIPRSYYPPEWTDQQVIDSESNNSEAWEALTMVAQDEELDDFTVSVTFT